MPHLTIEYSANLDERLDIAAVCAAVADAIFLTGLFERGAIRVRAIRCEAYAVADQMAQNAFLDMSFRIGEGRSPDDKKRTGEAIFSAVGRRLAPLFDAPHFALSLEIREIDAALSWKRNSMHARLRGQSTEG